jgi:hypothetical protein
MEELKLAIMDPFNMMWGKIAGFLPTLVSVLIVLFVGWMIAAILQKLVVRFLKLARLDTISEKSGIANVLLKGDISQTLSEIIGSLVYWLFMLVVILAAVNVLNLNEAAALLNSVILYIPRVIAALFILVLGIFFASVLATTVRTTAANSGVTQAKGLGRLTQVIIIIFTVVQSLQQLRIDVSILNLIVQATVGAVAVGAAIALGLGCKDMAGKFVQDLIDSFKSK